MKVTNVVIPLENLRKGCTSDQTYCFFFSVLLVIFLIENLVALCSCVVSSVPKSKSAIDTYITLYHPRALSGVPSSKVGSH